ncbi:MAG: VWA domain-containing protein [Gammaproteobacteria bacterium]|nr:VWA domain-containing protein [Gammaproteobacteria bacterium]
MQGLKLSISTFLFGAMLTLSACSQHQDRPNEDQNLRTEPVAENEAALTSPVTPVVTGNAELRRRQDAKAQSEKSLAPGTLSFETAQDAAAILPSLRYPSEPVNRENYHHFKDNPVFITTENPVSTFSVDVDTGSYANVRRMLEDGYLPPEDAVRVEEMINYFSYGYAVPKTPKVPFSVTTELATAPWNDDTLLLHIGIKGYEVPRAERPPANLVFLIDVSGSMNSSDKLGLLKQSLKLLTRQLDAEDSISMVVYAGASGVVLQPTAGNRKGEIIAALEQLTAGGSTNGAAGINLAYTMAEQAYRKGAINRVILATDGDFNVGTVNFDQLVDLIEQKRQSGITLTTLGFGTGNYNDHLMEQLADAGNGNYSYIDSIKEARKVLVEEMSSTLQVIAGDVKAQIEFNPGLIAEYRLIGYENRILRREDFNNDKVDAGDKGAGHTVTAIYELTLTNGTSRWSDPLRYGEKTTSESHGNELGFLKLRYKLPNQTKSKLIAQPVLLSERRDMKATSDSFRFAAAVAAFGQKLRGGRFLGEYAYNDIRSLANAARGEDAHGYRGEFIAMIELADALSQPLRQASR